jgi:hypothetical protein
MRPEPEMIPVLIDAAKALRGSQKRLSMAKTVQAMGPGGQRWAEVHLGWCRDTIRKGTHELRSGMTCVDAFSSRRRKPVEEHLPQGYRILSPELNRAFSRYSSLAAHFSRLVSIPRLQLVSRLSRPRANRRITLRFAGA